MIWQMGRVLIVVGAVIVVLGGLLMLFGRYAPSGKLLPGDIVIRRPGCTFYFPLATMIAISVVGSGLMWIISYLRR